MKKLVLNPDGWPCTLAECPPGAFLHSEKHLGFKSEYHTSTGKIEAYNEAGEFYCGDPKDLVQPLLPEWLEDE